MLFDTGHIQSRVSPLKVHFSSFTDDWSTPQDVFDYVNKTYGPFELDVCASESNAKCRKYFTKNENGLVQEWSGKCWMNPPYGREISLWIQKAYESSLNGTLVACLIPSRTDTTWWHDFVMRGQIFFIKGRLNFGKARNNAPFPSALVIFGGDS